MSSQKVGQSTQPSKTQAKNSLLKTQEHERELNDAELACIAGGIMAVKVL